MDEGNRHIVTRVFNYKVADCKEQDSSDQKRQEMTVLQYIQYWEGRSEKEASIQKTTYEHSLLYLKDWHFVKEYPKYVAYTTPKFFSDDCLNDYLDYLSFHGDYKSKLAKDCSDYRFVYLGPRGTWTPLHADVLRSYSWSANVCGRKRWHLLSPEQIHLLYDRFNRSTVYDIYADVSPQLFPRFTQTCWIECIQEKGEALFVPSGWYHQVTNMVDTLSINHNWLNACNLHWSWRLLIDDYKETVASIEDIREISDDFESLCQRNLAANSGMNFEDFCKLIAYMMRTSISSLAIISMEVSLGLTSFPRTTVFHLLFNLLSIQRIARDMCSKECFLMEARVRSCWCSKKLYDYITCAFTRTSEQCDTIFTSSDLAQAPKHKIQEDNKHSVAQDGNGGWPQHASTQLDNTLSTAGSDEIRLEDDFRCLEVYFSSPGQVEYNKIHRSEIRLAHEALSNFVLLKGRECFACLSSPSCILEVIDIVLDVWESTPSDCVLPEDVQIDKNCHI